MEKRSEGSFGYPNTHVLFSTFETYGMNTFQMVYAMPYSSICPDIKCSEGKNNEKHACKIKRQNPKVNEEWKSAIHTKAAMVLMRQLPA